MDQDIELDSMQNGEARLLIAKHVPERALPPNQSNPKEWTFDKLMACLRNEEESKFLDGINAFVASNSEGMVAGLFATIDNNKTTLLIEAVRHDLVIAVQHMLDLGADVNIGYKTMPIENACIFGRPRSLEILLNAPMINVKTEKPLLIIVVKYIVENVEDDYKECFQLLLENEKICIDWQDEIGCSALYHAVYDNNSYAVTELMKSGAYFAVQNKFDRYSISNINPKVLEKRFDNCITTNELQHWSYAFEINFDYTNFVQRNNENCINQMDCISFMSQSNDLKHLIKHPLILEFLSLKWKQIFSIYALNVFVCVLFAVVTTTYIWLCSEGIENNSLRVMSFSLLSYIMARELLQLMLSPCDHLKNWQNYVDGGLIIFTLLTILTPIIEICDEKWRKALGAITVLFISFDLFITVGSFQFWSFSAHYEMLITVTKSYFKSLCLYTIILLGFSLSFFILLRKTIYDIGNEYRNCNGTATYCNMTITSNDTDVCEKNNFNNFTNIGFSIMKTLVMTTGEIDAADINFNENPSSYIIFLIFIFLVPTIIANLLNGLAVSDTQLIKSEAELNNVIHQIQLLKRYEGLFLSANELVTNKKDFSCELNILKWFFRLLLKIKPLNNLIKVFLSSHKSIPHTYRLQPNETKRKYIKSKLRYLHNIWGSNTNIKNLVHNVMKKKKQEEFEEFEKKRLVNIENSLNSYADKLMKITEKIDQLMEKIENLK